MDHFWELGEGVEMRKSWEAGDGKGGLSQLGVVIDDLVGAINRISCFF